MNKSRWLNYAIVFLLGIVIALIVFVFFLSNKKEQKNESMHTQRSSVIEKSSQQSRKEEQLKKQPRNGFPYAVDMTSEQELIFIPRGNSVGSLHSGIIISIIPMDNGYSVKLVRSYHDATMDFNDRSTYRAEIKNSTTERIFVQGYDGSTPKRDVNVNTEISLGRQLSNSGKTFSDWEGAKLYLFYDSEGTLSLAVPDVDVGKEGQYFEYQQ